MTPPVIDLNDNTSDLALDAGLAQTGFLQLIGTGMRPDLITHAFQTSLNFFSQADRDKRAYAYRSAEENFGYQAVGEERLNAAAPPDVKETFTMRNVAHTSWGDDRWPDGDFRATIEAFHAAAWAFGHTLMHRLARILGEPEPFFSNTVTGENTTLRLLHYPAEDPVTNACADNERDALGAGAHTDYGLLTLLFQRDVSGLQVLTKDNQWINIPPRNDAVVVNCGDLLERWSNGRYRSTLHRVKRMPPGQSRQSIALFIDPDSDTLVQPLPSCVSADRPAQFAPITAGEHVQNRIRASHLVTSNE